MAALILLGAAASGPAAASAGGTPGERSSVEVAMATPWASTEDLVPGAEARAAVERLAAFGRIESGKISADGRASEPHRAFVELVALTTTAERVALLRHESAAVRGYMMLHAVETLQAPLAAIRPLLRDETPVPGQTGSIRTEWTIAHRTVNALCANAAVALVADELEVAANEAVPDALRAQAVVCLAQQRPHRALGWARPMLRHPDGTVRRQAVTAFAVAGATDEADTVERLADDEDRGVRAAVASAVARLGGRQEIVLRLLDDHDDYVRYVAGMAYVETTPLQESVLVRLLADPVPRVRDGVAEAMARHGVLVHHLEPILVGQRADGRIMQALAERDDAELAPLMRRLLAADSGYVRERATDWLGRHGDASDLPALRAQLTAPTIGERRHAAHALATRGDLEAVAHLESMLRSDANPHGRIAAAEALAALVGEAARSAIAAAVAAETTWARASLVAILDALTDTADGAGD